MSPRKIESVRLTRERAPRLISWQTAILRSREGAMMGVVATGVDITEPGAAIDVVWISTALAALPSPRRFLVHLCFYDGFTHSQIVR